MQKNLQVQQADGSVVTVAIFPSIKQQQDENGQIILIVELNGVTNICKTGVFANKQDQSQPQIVAPTPQPQILQQAPPQQQVGKYDFLQRKIANLAILNSVPKLQLQQPKLYAPQKPKPFVIHNPDPNIQAPTKPQKAPSKPARKRPPRRKQPIQPK